MLQKYKTLIGIGQSEIIEKKSRFIGTAAPAASEDAAQEFIASCKKKYRDASHNTFAYQVGQSNELQRISDDGEPSGTAGLHLLDVLKNGEIKNAVIVVTRYFGGVLLGTGGLARAYGKAAKQAVCASVVKELILHREAIITLDYTLLDKITRNALQSGCVIQDTTYTDVVKITILAAEDYFETYTKNVVQLTNGRVNIEQGNFMYL